MINIVLTGLPGSGKTTIGKQLSQKTGLPFFDLDDEIEKASSMTIPNIFASIGEKGFRRLETEAVHRMSAHRGIILATGGGTIMNNENMATLSQNGLIIFLDRPLEEINKNLDTSCRPLLKDDAEALIRLNAERCDSYLSTADYVLRNMGTTYNATEMLEVACLALKASDYGVIGDPIGHSLSPKIHKAAFNAQSIESGYDLIRVPKEALGIFVAAVKKSDLKGFNVTAPHKKAIMPMLDEISHDAGLCGAVNTVVLQKGRLYGYNTDIEGLSMALSQFGYPLRNKNITILGAGGAARAAALKSGLENAKGIHIAARDASKAEALSAYAEGATGIRGTFGNWENDQLAKACENTDILINATPLGMSGIKEDFPDTSFLARLPREALVCDLIYSPPETPLLKEARRLGLKGINGLSMLIYQALLAQEIFLDRKIDIPSLYKTIFEQNFNPKRS